MKKLTALLLALVMALSLVACGTKEKTVSLAGTWQYAMDMTELMNEEMSTALELDASELTGSFSVYLAFTATDEGTYTMGIDMDATGDSLNSYMQTLIPVITEMTYAAAEAEGMSREDFDDAISSSIGMTTEEYIAGVLGAFDMSALMTTLLGDSDASVSSGWYKAVDGRLYLADTEEELDSVGSIGFTLEGDTLTWTDDDGAITSELTAEEQALLQFPMTWSKAA